jgi:hypothetical protein
MKWGRSHSTYAENEKLKLRNPQDKAEEGGYKNKSYRNRM